MPHVSGPHSDDTIAAISTPMGEGGIGIVRLSGSDSIAIAARIFKSATGRSLNDGGRPVFYGEVVDADGTPIDEVLVHLMSQPHSYTREDVVEINAHGGPGPVRAILDRVMSEGARLAQPGEFTQRAFLNGRIDLVQAEAVIDRIRARTRTALKAADAAARGTLSREITQASATLVGALSRIEAAVDFPEEDLPDLVDEPLKNSIIETAATLNALLATADAGRLLREGASVAIIGRPNVGKSSLFNTLVRDARAIVTAQPGTTRDVLEETITIEGVPVLLSDTAGLRDADDEVERIGVERARTAAREADVVLLVIDATEGAVAEEQTLARSVAETDTPILLVINKIDAAPDSSAPDWNINFTETCRVSAVNESGLSELERAIANVIMGDAGIDIGRGLITRAHQRDSLRRACDALASLTSEFERSPEFLSIDLREAIACLGEITGETTPDHILEQIFANFCIGK